MIYDFAGEVGLIVENQRYVILARAFVDVFGGYYRELVPGDVARKRDVFDAPARNLTPHSCAMEHFRKRNVIDVERGSGDFLPAFFARRRFADGVFGSVGVHWVELLYNAFADPAQGETAQGRQGSITEPSAVAPDPEVQL
jgi:hypothetical protein